MRNVQRRFPVGLLAPSPSCGHRFLVGMQVRVVVVGHGGQESVQDLGVGVGGAEQSLVHGVASHVRGLRGVR